MSTMKFVLHPGSAGPLATCNFAGTPGMQTEQPGQGANYSWATCLDGAPSTRTAAGHLVTQTVCSRRQPGKPCAGTLFKLRNLNSSHEDLPSPPLLPEPSTRLSVGPHTQPFARHLHKEVRPSTVILFLTAFQLDLTLPLKLRATLCQAQLVLFSLHLFQLSVE